MVEKIENIVDISNYVQILVIASVSILTTLLVTLLVVRGSKRSKAVRRRQWGAERRTHPLPIVHEKPSTRKMALSRLSIVATASLWVVYVIYTIIRQFLEAPRNEE